MRNTITLLQAMSRIEETLATPLSLQSLADDCYCSVSMLQKLFQRALRIGVREYADRRRLTQAAHALLDTQDTITGVALSYGYASPEVFTRAFQRLWGVSPSQFRKTWRSAGLFPRIENLITEGDGNMRKKMDITDLYDALRARQNTYVLSFDIMNLMPINDISRTAGDLAIVECLRRIDGALEGDQFAFRIGGDEFSMVTGLTAEEDVRACAARVLAHNGEPIEYNGQSIPVAMRAAAVRLSGENLRYATLYDTLNDAINHQKTDAQTVYFVP